MPSIPDPELAAFVAAQTSVPKTPRQNQIESPEFKEWFADSKIVHPDGSPRVVYHGTDKKFTRFDLSKTAQGVIWVSSDRDSIEKGESGADGTAFVMELFVSLRNPAGWEEYESLSIAQLHAGGYDGVILPNEDGSFDAFVFDPDQIVNAAKEI